MNMMLFRIVDGKPYYEMDEKLMEASIDDTGITIGATSSVHAEGGRYSANEIRAKLGNSSSITVTKTSKAKSIKK